VLSHLGYGVYIYPQDGSKWDNNPLRYTNLIYRMQLQLSRGIKWDESERHSRWECTAIPGDSNNDKCEVLGSAFGFPDSDTVNFCKTAGIWTVEYELHTVNIATG
jgi:hypothetical protein